MPSHRLSPLPQAASATPQQMTDGVLAVLSGTPLETVAAQIGAATTDLAEAIEVFRAAGQAALQAQAADRDWYQIRVQFPDWHTAEQSAVSVLGPRLDQLRDRGMVATWWFIRKHPCWRLRLRHGADVAPAKMKTAVNAVLDDLTAAEAISRWWPAIYEPETAAFGGPPAMDIAHDLLCANSHHVLHYLRRPEPGIGRRELSMLLCSTLFHATGLDSFEHGDVWHRVTSKRPLPAAAPTDRINHLADTLRTLITVPIHPTAPLFAPDGPLSFAGPWAAAFDSAGQALGEAATAGHLDRGVRNILTHLVIFHWNQLGLSATTQGILARAAKEAVLPRN